MCSAVAAFGSGLLHTELSNDNAVFFIADILCMFAALISLRVGAGKTPSTPQPALATAEG